VANRSLSAQALPSNPPPVDYYFPFGEPSLLIPTLSCNAYLPSSPAAVLDTGQPLSAFLASLRPPPSLAGPPPAAPLPAEAVDEAPAPPLAGTTGAAADAVIPTHPRSSAAAATTDGAADPFESMYMAAAGAVAPRLPRSIPATATTEAVADPFESMFKAAAAKDADAFESMEMAVAATEADAFQSVDITVTTTEADAFHAMELAAAEAVADEFNPNPPILAPSTIMTPEDAHLPSHQVYILGDGIRAFYVAHALAGLPDRYPAPRLLFSGRAPLRDWADQGSTISVHVDGQWTTRDRVEAERLDRPVDEEELEPPIENLVITAPCFKTTSLVRRIRHRITAETTICLIQDGLGVAEELNRAVFRDPWSRPSYVLGLVGHELYAAGNPYTVTNLRSNRLYLAAMHTEYEAPNARAVPMTQRQNDVHHFMRLMTTAADLRAHGGTYHQWLVKRLPRLMFDSIVDPVAAVLNMPYSMLPRNHDARHLMQELVDEVTKVLLSFPLVRVREDVAEYVQSGVPWRRLLREMRRRSTVGAGHTVMAEMIREGSLTDIGYQAGWFLSQGEYAGVDCPQLRSVVRLVKAKGYGSYKQGEIDWDAGHLPWTGHWRRSVDKGGDEGERAMWPDSTRSTVG